MPVAPLVSSGLTIAGEMISYPVGAPAKITAAVVMGASACRPRCRPGNDRRSMEIPRLGDDALVARMTGPAGMGRIAGGARIWVEHVIGVGDRGSHALRLLG